MPASVAWRACWITLFVVPESIPLNRFPGSLNVYKFGLRARISKRLRSPGIDSYESILPGW
jgi:hypothetical protein